MARYLVFADLPSAQARNQAEAVARLCEAPTIEWWATIQHPTNGQAALVIEDSSPFDAAPDARGLGGLSDSEIATLQPESVMDAGGWFATQEGA